MQLDLKVGFGLQLTGKKHSFGIFASLARGGLEMNRGRKVQSRDRPAEERQRGSGGDGVTDCWVSGSASLQKHCSPPPPPPDISTLHTGWVPGPLSVPLGTDLQPQPVGLSPGLIWRGNVSPEFPAGH